MGWHVVGPLLHPDTPLHGMGVAPSRERDFWASGAQGNAGASPAVPPQECPTAGPDTGDTLWHDLPLPLGPRPSPQPPHHLPGGGGAARLCRAAGGEQEPQVRHSTGREWRLRGVQGCPLARD